MRLTFLGRIGLVAHPGGWTHTGIWWGKKKPNGNKLLGRPSHRWKDNIKMDVKQAEWEEVE